MSTMTLDPVQPLDAAATKNQGDAEISSNPHPIDSEAVSFAVQEPTEEEDGREDEHEAAQKAGLAMNFYAGFRTLEEERESRKLELRTKQAIVHTALTEKRILDLEKLVHQLGKDVYKLPDDFYQPKKPKHFVYSHELKRSSASYFRLTLEVIELPKSQQPALEVLISDKVRSTPEGNTPVRRSTGLAEVGMGTRPERLRIRYLPLIRHLQSITKTFISDNLSPPNGKFDRQSPIVFLKPFKLLFVYEQEIRDSFKELQSEIDKENETTQDPQESMNTQSDITAATKTIGDTVSKDQPDQSIVKDEPDFDKTDLLADLGLLIRFLDEDLHETFELRSKIEQGIDTSIEYPDLWHLFHLGDIIVQKSGDQTFAWRLYNFTGGREPLVDKLERFPTEKPQRLDGFTIDAVSHVSKGDSQYVPVKKTFVIRPYLGRQKISSLSVYPFKFADPSVKEYLRQQGARYLDLTSPSYVHKTMKGKTRNNPQIDVDGQVIVDMTMAYAQSPHLQYPNDEVSEDDLTRPDKRETKIPQTCHHNDYDEGCCGGDVGYKDEVLDELSKGHYLQQHATELRPRSAADLTKDDCLTLPESVHGFLLRSRRWIIMNTCDLSPATFTNSFESLLLHERHKTTIQSMVQRHKHGHSSTSVPTTEGSIGSGIDIVKGKGTGLIFLLHGAPGVGKTMTAECVADDSRRPLFPITCGDVGDTATQVEDNLHRNFNMAQKWDCVLLLDEADVFLGKRNHLDLTRNAVVSVFLRSLEYYTGILFLTTNRVGGIDSAFKSRIHMSLYYPPLGLDETVSLYQKFIDRTRSEQDRTDWRLFKIREKEILSFARKHFKKLDKTTTRLGTWNGRQIRNAFQAAIALAEYEGQHRREGSPKATLGKAQFQVVSDSSEEFERYLLNTLQRTDTEIAQAEQVRAPDYPYVAGVHAPAAPVYPPSTSRSSKSQKRAKHAAKDSESEEESESVSEEEDDDDEDEEDGDSDTERKPAKKNTKVSGGVVADEKQSEIAQIKAMLARLEGGGSS